jgi:transcriptional regulator with XRE-family HTH domain
MKHPFTFADNLRAERARRQWTLAQLSERTGISAQTLSRFENNAQQPKLDQVSVIAKALAVDIYTLLPQPAAGAASTTPAVAA